MAQKQKRLNTGGPLTPSEVSVCPTPLWGAAAALGPSPATVANASCGSSGTLNATCGQALCGWLDFSCTTTTDAQLQGLLLLLLVGALLWRHHVAQRYAKLPGFRRPF